MCVARAHKACAMSDCLPQSHLLVKLRAMGSSCKHWSGGHTQCTSLFQCIVHASRRFGAVECSRCSRVLAPATWCRRPVYSMMMYKTAVNQLVTVVIAGVPWGHGVLVYLKNCMFSAWRCCMLLLYNVDHDRARCENPNSCLLYTSPSPPRPY